MKLKDENILKLVFSSISSYDTKELTDIIFNHTISKVLIRLLTYENIYKSLSINRILFESQIQQITTLTKLQNGNLISTHSNNEDNTLMQWHPNNYNCIGATPSIYAIDSLTILPQGGFITISLDNSYILIWDEDHTCYKTLPLCSDKTLLLPNGNLFCSIHHHFLNQTVIRILDCKDNYKNVKRIVDDVNSAKTTVNLSKNKYATAGEVIKIWDIDKNYECISTFGEHVGLITCLLYIERFDLLISGSNDRIIKVWDLKDSIDCPPPIIHLFNKCSFYKYKFNNFNK
jgi:WD40 repeat protein